MTLYREATYEEVQQWLLEPAYVVPVEPDRRRVFAAIEQIEMQPGLDESQCVDLILAALGIGETP